MTCLTEEMMEMTTDRTSYITDDDDDHNTDNDNNNNDNNK